MTRRRARPLGSTVTHSLALALLVLLAFNVPTTSVAQSLGGQKTPWCEGVSRSSFVNTVCYDERNQRLSLQLNDRWYQYCGVSRGLAQDLLAAPSVGRFFHSHIRGRYEC